MTSYDLDKIRVELDSFLEEPHIHKAVQEAVEEILRKFRKNPELQAFSVSITPAKFPSVEFPKEAQLIRVYGSKARHAGKIERHPNSLQSLTTIEGEGVTKILGPPGESRTDYSAGKYWSFVEPNVWHQPVAGNEDWIAATFHSASETELIDEYQ